MKLIWRLLLPSIFFAACNSQSEGLAQAPLSIFTAEGTTLPGFHTDVFGSSAPLDTNKPIDSMSLRLELHGMNQLQANGQRTVFRTDISLTDAPNDSHFLLNPLQFTVLSSFEDANLLQADIEFTTPVVFPSRFPMLVQAVAFDGHENPDGSFGTLTGSGRYTDGSTFRFSVSIIPEPSSAVLAGLLAGTCICARHRLSPIYRH